MGGRDKALLAHPSGGTLLEHTLSVIGDVPHVIVGEPKDRAAYRALEILPDAIVGIGPLGGLIALLERGDAIAIACDMPFVTRAVFEQLMRAPAAPIVAPKREGRWEPLFARYQTKSVLARARDHAKRNIHSLQALLDGVACELPLEDPRLLDDWDTLDDVRTRST